MKKLFALLLALVMMMSLVACGPKEPEIELPESAQVMMQTIFDAWDFEYKDYLNGGGPTTMVMGAPAAMDLTSTDDTDFLKFNLCVPEANVGDLESVSNLMGMNASSFTVVAIEVKDAVAFAATMENVLTTAQFVCGVPEHLILYTLGNGYVLYGIGTVDNMNSFRTAMTAAYPEFVAVYDDLLG